MAFNYGSAFSGFLLLFLLFFILLIFLSHSQARAGVRGPHHERFLELDL